jgi:hypothetical protein
MAEWIYFIHAPRENFADTMTDEEEAVWSEHFERLNRLLAEGVLGVRWRLGAGRTARVPRVTSSRSPVALRSTAELADLRY